MVFRAEDAPVDSRPDYWQHVIEEMVFPMDLRHERGPEIRSRLDVGVLGPVRVIQFSNSPGQAHRGLSHIRKSAPDVYHVFVQAQGTTMSDREWNVLRPDGFVFNDLTQPFRAAFPAHRSILVTFPKSMLPVPEEKAAQLVGTYFPGEMGTSGLVAALVRRLPGCLDEHDAATAARLGTSVIDLVGAALARHVNGHGQVPPESRRQALLMRVHAFIEERLPDPGLSPEVIAAAHHVSLRYLYKLFEVQEESVANWIRRRRLERCRQDLLDASLAARPVSAVAARWGFADPAHFNRVFRAAYGMPPGEFRRCFARGQAPAGILTAGI